MLNASHPAATVLPAATQLTRYHALVAQRARPICGWLGYADSLRYERELGYGARQDYDRAIKDCLVRAGILMVTCPEVAS